MELYQTHKVNPLSGCLPLLLQFPILIALYHVFINGFKDESLAILYPFVYNPGHIDAISLGIINLSETNIYLAVIAATLQYFQSKMLMGGKTKEKEENKKATPTGKKTAPKKTPAKK